ncbi:hypothetical protein GCM10027037_13730 [Mucilaginibacter koreensis]
MRKLYFSLVAIALLLTSCKKDHTAKNLSGSYQGTVRMVYLSATSPADVRGNMTLVLSSGSGFTSTITIDNVTSKRAGTYTVKDDALSFVDTVKQSDMNWKYNLSGDYSYGVSKDSLVLMRQGASSIYQYDLIRK